MSGANQNQTAGSGQGVRWAHVALATSVAALFLALSWIPLRASDLWTHERWGQWILEHGRLPAEDPFLVLAEGVPVVDRDWLSQVIFAKVSQVAGSEGLSLMFALSMLAGYLALGRVFYLQGGKISVAIAGGALVLATSFSRLATARPENFAFLCFAILLLLLIRVRALDRCGSCSVALYWPPWVWLAVPAVLALWANVHGSFPIGVLTLACAAGGRFLDLAWKSRSPRVALEDAEFRRRLWLVELGFAATLLNPYGIKLWLAVASFSGNPNLENIVEWDRLTILGPGGREFAASLLVLMLLLRHAKRAVPASHALLLLALAVGSCAGIRFLTWYGPAFALLALPLAQELWERRPSQWRLGVREWSTHRVRLTVLVVVLWIGFALSPFGNSLLGGAGRSAAQLYGEETPFDSTAFLRSRRPPGLAWAPQYWSDWLMRFGPPGFETMVGSNLHLIPPSVWRDYMRVLDGDAGWGGVLDRYRIDTVFLLQAVQPAQVRALRRDANWTLAFEDEQAAIFVRRASAGASVPDEESPPTEVAE